MASGLYANYKELCLGGGTHALPDLNTDAIDVGIVSGADYTENLATHQDWSDTTYALDTCYNSEPTVQLTAGNSTVTAGVWDNSDNQVFTAVAIDGVKDVDAIVHFLSSGVVTTDTLICFHDGFAAVTPNGGDITVAYNASGIFAL